MIENVKQRITEENDYCHFNHPTHRRKVIASVFAALTEY
jgi:hypothetical protein